MNRPLAPRGGNDRVYTPPDLAWRIVEHFGPFGRCLEPCRGQGAFYNALFAEGIEDLDWCEIDEGSDFLKCEIEPCDWIVTNPPWSKLRAFLRRGMEVADNVVFLCLVNAFFMKARQRDLREAGFGMREILFVPTPPKPWPQTGFSLGAVHVQREWRGDLKMSWL